jgi:hypothetical protein
MYILKSIFLYLLFLLDLPQLGISTKKPLKTISYKDENPADKPLVDTGVTGV